MVTNATRVPDGLLRFGTICGRTFHNADPEYFPRATFRGLIIYFCTGTCLGEFTADPARFYRTHRMSGHETTLRAK